MKLADTHCHLYFDNYNKDRKAVLTRAGEAGVERILVPGIDLVTSQEALILPKNSTVYMPRLGFILTVLLPGTAAHSKLWR